MTARLTHGGRIDRSRTLTFEFNGRRYTGHPGDTLASALIAQGVSLVGRSFKLHRPRGILSAGVEEPNALVQLFDGARTVPNARMTEVALVDGLRARSVNARPSVEFDLRAANGWFARLMPAGFYYKTFMASLKVWHFFEEHIRAAGGLGHSPTEPDPDCYEKRYAHCDVLIVGGGIAGLSAALAAGETGARVILCDEGQEPGGWLLSSDASIEGLDAAHWVDGALERLAAMPEVIVLPRTTAFGYQDHNLLTLIERRTDHLPPTVKAETAQGFAASGARRGHRPPVFRERLWKVRAKRVVLATGAHERPLVFANNDLPGIMLAGAVATYVRRYAVLPGRNAVVFTNNDAGMEAALALSQAGARVRVVDAREQPNGSLTERARGQGIELIAGHAVVQALGRRRVRGVRISALDANGNTTGRPSTLDCDLLAVSGGFSPVIHLQAQAGGKARWDDDLVAFLPGEAVQGECSAGACAGAHTLREAAEQGTEAGAQCAGANDLAHPAPRVDDTEAGTIRPLWLVPHPLGPTRAPKQFVDLQNDVAASDLLLAVREGFESIEHVKRYTAMGFGTDQGKTGNINGMGIVAQALGKPIPAVGTTTFRPNYTPVTFGAVAGIELGEVFDPVRTTMLHDWHVSQGAHFEDVGQWKRPWFYPRAGESMAAAVRREVLAVRHGVGLLDASTLGKIDIQGPDSVTLLNRVYCNAWSKLAVGRARYGLMLDENGMVFDDGVTVRLGEHHYLMHTTSGGAARVLAWLERWLQTEWPELDVYLTSVTDHWATIAVAGPASRTLLSRVCADIDLDDEAFRFMSYRPGSVAGVAARVFRVSFSGERSYEINVPAVHALPVWQALMQAGKDLDATPYGTEAMHVLRAEKGFIIVGQDTDGSVSPIDLGMAGMVSTTKGFLGDRSLHRSDTARKDRKQLVGLLSEDPQFVMPEGAQILDAEPTQPPAEMVGHVTSSYDSPTLGRSIALALVRGGRERHGETVWVSAGAAAPRRATITSPVFYDAKGERQYAGHGAGTEDGIPAANAPGGALANDTRQPANGTSHGSSGRVQAHWQHGKTLLSLRGDADDAGFTAAVETGFGIALPTKACTTHTNDARRIVWAGPDEWILIAPGAERETTEHTLRQALDECRYALTDISGGYSILTLSGAAATDILAHGCPLDLHPRAFGPHACAGTHFFRAQIRLWHSREPSAFELLVRQSFIGYFNNLLESCSAECGLTLSESTE